MELVWEEDGREQSVEIGPDRPELMMGRHKDCDIRVSRSSVSRRHAAFSWASGQVIVTDQDSTAGTYIDGKKIRRARLEVGATVNCGGVMILLDGRPSRGRGRSAPVEEPPPRRSRSLEPEEPVRGGAAARSSRSSPPPDDPPPRSRRSRPEPEPEPEPPPRSRGRGGGGGGFEDFFSSSAPEPLHEPEPEPEPTRGGGFEDFFSSSAPEPLPLPEAGGRGGGGGRAKSGFDPDDFFGSDPGFDDWDPPAPVREPEPEPEPVPVPASAPRGPAHFAVYLLYVDDNGKESEVRVEREGDPVMIGRRSGAAVKVRNPSVSGKHCTVGWVDEEVVIRDLGSSNGTYINNERVRRGTVHDGDIIRCGRFELRVSFVEHKDIAQVEYEEWGDDDWGDDFDMGPPRFHLIWTDDRGDLTSVTMGENERLLAVGSRGCEINIERRDVEAEHCELNWDEGVLVVTDLQSETGTFVNDEAIEEESLRNGDVLVVGRARIHVIRGCSSERRPPTAENRSHDADLWTRHLDNRDDDLEILFIDGEEFDEGGKHELSIWGSGEARLEVITETERYSVDGRVDRDLRRLIYESLLRAGFPDMVKNKLRAGEIAPEITLFQGRDEARVVLSKQLVQRSPGYHEVLEVLRALSSELASQ